MSSSGYPDPSEFDEALYESLRELPDGSELNLDFARAHIDPGAATVTLPRDGVIRGMQVRERASSLVS